MLLDNIFNFSCGQILCTGYEGKTREGGGQSGNPWVPPGACQTIPGKSIPNYMASVKLKYMAGDVGCL
jgi:hypothetical protein